MHFRLLAIIILCCLFILPSSAQIPGNKLFAYSNGDIWTWFEGGTAQQITTWGFNGGPVLAPTERYIAYLSIATEAVEEINAEQTYPFMGTPPTNIWIMDTATQLAERIALQENYPTLRGIPAWSPDGTKLAWLEFTQLSQAGMARLLVYDMETRTTTVLNDRVNMGFQDGGYYVHSVQWGSMGISRLYFTFVENGQLQFILELYDDETGSRQDFIIAANGGMGDSQSPTPIDYVWVEYQARSMIAILMNNGDWRLLNPLDGSMNKLSQTPHLINRNGNARLFPLWVQGWQIQWVAMNESSVSELPFVNYSISQGIPALSPDGLSVAWNNSGDLAFIRIGEVDSSVFLESSEEFASVQPSSVVWSSMRWVADGALGDAVDAPAVVSGDACGMPSRIVIGDIVTVTEGEPNNVREEARLDSAIVAQFTPNDMAEVRDGPVCIDGFRWWFVASDTFEGWTAEGNATEYWLEPVRG